MVSYPLVFRDSMTTWPKKFVSPYNMFQLPYAIDPISYFF